MITLNIDVRSAVLTVMEYATFAQMAAGRRSDALRERDRLFFRTLLDDAEGSIGAAAEARVDQPFCSHQREIGSQARFADGTRTQGRRADRSGCRSVTIAYGLDEALIVRGAPGSGASLVPR